MSKRFIITLATLIIIGGGALAAVFLAKGFTFSPKTGTLVGTGIISATSVPDGASVYIDGHLATATNTTISSLSPKKYNIRIVKEGFIPWEKEMEVKEGVVTEIKATLFPALPTIFPLTFNGVMKPVLSPDGQKLAFAVPMQESSQARQRGGIWVWTMTSQPISLNRGAEPHQVVMATNTLDFTKSTIKWSPDSKQILVTLYEGAETEANFRNYLLNPDSYASLDSLKDTTPTIPATLKGWEDDQKTKDGASVAAIKDPTIRQEASSSAMLKWSPDESKIMIGDPSANSGQVATGKQKIASTEVQYQNVRVVDIPYQKTYSLPVARAYFWLPDSRHVILVQEDKVSICEFDGTNISVIFAGKFEDSEVFPWPDSSKLVVLTTFNTPTASTPNLFGINLK